MKKVKYVGLDVHKETIQIAVISGRDNQPEYEKAIPNDLNKIEKELRKIGKNFKVVACYEAGCLGYGLQRHISGMGIECLVVAPSHVPRGSADRIKTDKRDARLLSKMLKAGELETIYIPTPEDEATRDLLRSREDVRIDLVHSKQRLNHFLLRNGFKYDEHLWTQKHSQWMNGIKLENNTLKMTFEGYRFRVQQGEESLANLDLEIVRIAQSKRYTNQVEKLRCFKGINYLTALSIVVEIGDFRRFKNAESFMAYLGLVPGEHSSGNKRRQTGITKSGNGHMRRLMIEAAWHYANNFKGIGKALTERRMGKGFDAILYADRAISRLRKKYFTLINRGKNKNTAIVGVARELSGFVWGMMLGNLT